jgi:peptidoglycan hydrolase CwlO-like protein
MPRTRISAALYLILVFASGILVGVVSYRLYAATTVNANVAPRTMEQYRKQFFADMRQKVGASDAQISQINAVLDESKAKFDKLHADEKPLKEKIDQDRIEGIRAVLSDSQRTAYDNWRAERARIQAEQQKKQQK